MKYTEAIEYMESLPVCNEVPGSESMKQLWKRMGNPQDKLSCVYIEGNRKVNAFVATVLKCAGYKIGRYAADFIYECREKYQVRNKPITKKAFCDIVEQIRGICESLVEEGYRHPTRFEVENGIAFAYFEQQNCQVILLETMLDLEQMWKISGVSVHMNAVKKIKYGLDKQKFDYKGWNNLEISLAGVGQIENAVRALEILCQIRENGFLISEAALRKGLKETVYPGCFSVIGKKPYFVVDSAKSEEAVFELLQSIECYFRNRRIIYILGMCRECEVERIIDMAHGYADWIIAVTPPANPSAMGSYELATEIAKVHPSVTAVDSLEEAVEVAYLLKGKEDVIIAFGCRSMLGKLVEIMHQK